MVAKTNIVFEKYSEIWANNKALTANIAKSKAIVKKIEDAAKRQQFDNSTFVEEKKKTRSETTTQAIVMCGIIRSYANAIGDEDLYKNVNYSKSKMDRLKDTVFVTFCDFLSEKSKSLLKSLKDYGMTQAMIDDFKASALLYNAALAKPQAAIAARAEATADIKKLANDLVSLYSKGFDNSMLLYMTTNPHFYVEYIFAREIFDTGSRALSLYGKVIDSETSMPINRCKVTVKFKAGSELADKVKSTSSHGNYQFKKLGSGICTLVFEKAFYDKLSVKVNLIKNEGVRVDAKLVKTISN